MPITPNAPQDNVPTGATSPDQAATSDVTPDKIDAERSLEEHGLPEKHADMVAHAEGDPEHQPTSHQGDPEEGWSRAALLQRAGDLGIGGADAMSDDALKSTIEKHERDARIQKSAGVASHEASSDATDPGDGVIV
jgi:hypothetical protein